jgi:ABC-type thiamine transport system substrate-binding protein
MMTPGFQNEIPTNNWMLPAAAPVTMDLPQAFATLVSPERTLLFRRRKWPKTAPPGSMNGSAP